MSDTAESGARTSLELATQALTRANVDPRSASYMPLLAVISTTIEMERWYVLDRIEEAEQKWFDDKGGATALGELRRDLQSAWNA